MYNSRFNAVGLIPRLIENDTTVALDNQRAINSAIVASETDVPAGNRVIIPPGAYYIAGTIVVPSDASVNQ